MEKLKLSISLDQGYKGVDRKVYWVEVSREGDPIVEQRRSLKELHLLGVDIRQLISKLFTPSYDGLNFSTCKYEDLSIILNFVDSEYNRDGVRFWVKTTIEQMPEWLSYKRSQKILGAMKEIKSRRLV